MTTSLVLLTVLVVLLRTLRFKTERIEVPPVDPIEVDSEKAVRHLSKSIQFETISSQDSRLFDEKPFLEFHQFIQKSYPLIHKNLTREIVNKYALLYEWKGSEPGLKPIIFIAHTDVVPVEPGTEKDWQHAPYSGSIADGYIWGRGTLDMKGILIALLESVEHLIQQGFKPKRTIYLALGHDEEIGGNKGAAKIAEHLKAKGVKGMFSLDEGMAVLVESGSPTGKPLAVVGIAEKGYATIKLTAQTEGGHSSIPPEKTTLTELSKAILDLQARQMPNKLSGVAGQYFDHVGPIMGFGKRLILANRWLFSYWLLKMIKNDSYFNAMTRTTMAPTMINGGVKENVLPSHAYALINFRILPGQTVDDVIAHVKKIINNSTIEVSIHGRVTGNPTPVSETECAEYGAIRKCIRQFFPDVTVTPGLVLGGTDSKHFLSIVDNTYRFEPFLYNSEDLKRIHGTDERLSVDDYIRSIQFYAQVMKEATS